jgi:hypothetical protein
MPCLGFEPTIPASDRAKTVHALDRLATVTGFAELVPANKDMLSNTGGTGVSVAICTWKSRLNRIRVSHRGSVAYERPVYVPE